MGPPGWWTWRWASWSAGHLRFGDCGNRYFEARDADRQLRPLARRRVRREPLQPLLVHSAEVILIREDDGRAHDLVERASSLLQNRGDVRHALSRLLLDRRRGDGARGRIVR